MIHRRKVLVLQRAYSAASSRVKYGPTCRVGAALALGPGLVVSSTKSLPNWEGPVRIAAAVTGAFSYERFAAILDPFLLTFAFRDAPFYHIRISGLIATWAVLPELLRPTIASRRAQTRFSTPPAKEGGRTKLGLRLGTRRSTC